MNNISALQAAVQADPRLTKPLTKMATFIKRVNVAQQEILASKKGLIVFKAGRGIGKSLCISYKMAQFLITTKRRTCILIAPTIGDAHSILIESEASGLAFFFDIQNKNLFKYDKQNNYLIYLPTQSRIFIYGAMAEDKVRGQNADLVIADEFAMYQQPGVIHQAEFTLREKVDKGEVRIKQMILASTPKNNETTKHFITEAKKKDGLLVEGSIFVNKENLDEAMLHKFVTRHKKGSKLYQQEIMGEVVSNLDTAIATSEQLKKGRREKPLPMDKYEEIVISIDPAVSSNAKSADTGIIVAGLHMPDEEIQNKLDGVAYDKHVDVLEDATTSGSIDVWLAAVDRMWHKWGKPLIIVEVNHGGNLLQRPLISYNEEFRVKEIRATKSKSERLLPLSAAYLQGEIHHIGYWGELEDQLMYWDPDDKVQKKDRADALGHAFNHLRGKKVSRGIDIYGDD